MLFIDVTVHYISTDWKLKSHSLRLQIEFDTEMAKNMFLDWKTKKKSLSGITTDNS